MARLASSSARVRLARVEVHLGADRRGLGELLLADAVPRRRAGRRGRAARVLRRCRASPRPRSRPAAPPARRSRAARRHWRGRPRGSRRPRGCASRCRARRRSGWPPSSRRPRLGPGAGGQHGVPHGRQVAQPLGVGGTEVVVGGGVVLRPPQQPGVDGGDVVGTGERARPAADRGEHVEAAARVDLEQAAADQVAGQLGGLGHRQVEHPGEDAEADGEVEQADPPQGGRARAVEQRRGPSRRPGRG